jgi:hypothetical protein
LADGFDECGDPQRLADVMHIADQDHDAHDDQDEGDDDGQPRDRGIGFRRVDLAHRQHGVSERGGEDPDRELAGPVAEDGAHDAG